MTEKIGWGIIGTGNIAAKFAEGVRGSWYGQLAAIGSRAKEKAKRFADKYDIPYYHGTYEGLLTNPKVDAVYIATPHPMHAQWAINAAKAGKHILCEKPIALNHPEAMRIVAAAKEHRVFLMEAFMYRCHPQTAKIAELILDGAIGDVKLIQASFSFRAGFDPDSRIYNNHLGGGGILDVGGYPVSMARFLAGVVDGKGFLDPVKVKGDGHLCETGVDDYAVAVLRFPNDILAQVSSGVGVMQDNICRIYGTEGSIIVPRPWIPGRDGEPSKIVLNRREVKEITIRPDRPLYGIEADMVAENIEYGEAYSPAMSWNDTLGNMKTLDAWRESFDFFYDVETPESDMPPATGKKIQISEDAEMKYGIIPGLKKEVSRLVMGVDNQRRQTYANAMFDDYYERGGNCFDSAFVYGGGLCEEMLGTWVEKRGVRDNVVLLDKGAHTPHCDPEGLTKQLVISLERLCTDHVDIYMMHRDNPEVPAGEFVEVLNEHCKAGRIRVIGGSNWTIKRVTEFNNYAESKGLQGFAAVSNNISLARMLRPPWKGCINVGDEDSLKWFEKNQMALMPWSSQAQGFFAAGDPENRENESLVKCWYSEGNFCRLKRARVLAEEMGVEPINIALAYVLCQPFPTFPLIGPRSIFETMSCMKALNIDLTRKQMKWLNLES